MTKQIQSGSPTATAKRFNLRGLLRAAITASVVASFGSVAAAQTSGQPNFALPEFPTDSGHVALPLPQEPSYLPTPSSSAPSNRSASHRVASLLGLKKANLSQTSTAAKFPTLPAPAFPSTASPACIANSLTTPAATVCCSSGGRAKSSDTESVVLASAQESSVTHTFSDAEDEQTLVPPVLDEAESTEEESLIDIDIPLTAPAAVTSTAQRLPELVKRPPAMQLHIGGAPTDSATLAPAPTAVKPQTASSNFTLSDSQESKASDTTTDFTSNAVKPATQPTFAVATSDPMNIRIEGEPGIAKAVPRSTGSSIGDTRNSQPATATASLSSSSSRNATHKSVSDRATSEPASSATLAGPSVGERLEVGLHEATNVETTQPISGLSIEHPELCQVLKSGERMISLVGLKAGQTRVALFTTDANGERRIEIREVMIAGTETRQADMKSMAKDISRSVHNMYPNSRIEVIAEAEGLTVQGYASTEDEAKKIISLVRRTSLQPVVDRLATYK